jgi:VTC domain
MNNSFHEILQRFAPISLDEMDGVSLMNRTDTKFMMHKNDLADILSKLPTAYRILEVNGERESKYETLYYDSENFLFYRRHHAGKKNRYKIRKRKYVESNLTFLEVKFKTNKDRTIKDRTKLPMIEEALEAKASSFILSETGINEDFVPKLWNSFTRMTFVDESIPERLTIDFNLSFHYGESRVSLPNIVICEVKQSKQNRHSPFMQQLKARLIRPESISKYCIGVALVYPEIKSNSFKEKLLKIRKLENELAA